MIKVFFLIFFNVQDAVKKAAYDEAYDSMRPPPRAQVNSRCHCVLKAS
jgi:hypothetical protein